MRQPWRRSWRHAFICFIFRPNTSMIHQNHNMNVVGDLYNWQLLIYSWYHKVFDASSSSAIWFDVRRSTGPMTLVSSIIAMVLCKKYIALRWRHNEQAGVSNHQPHHCLLNRLFRRRSKKTLKLRVTGLCVGNSPGTGEFPAQMASNAENVSIWWRHHR